MADRPRVSLADFEDFFDGWIARRVMVDKRDSRARTKLTAVDYEFVTWFDEHGIELVVDRDTLTHERQANPEAVASATPPLIAPLGSDTSSEASGGASAGSSASYTMQVTFGNDQHSVTLWQHGGSESIAERDYQAACLGVKQAQLIRHTREASQIVKSWEPTTGR